VVIERVYAIPFASPVAPVPVPVAGRDIMPLAIEQHHEIILAIESKDGPLAERLTREHALVARRNLEIPLGELEKLSRLRMPGTSLASCRSFMICVMRARVTRPSCASSA
jgi:GntR family transcriptional regulator of vanillate catabolism